MTTPKNKTLVLFFTIALATLFSVSSGASVRFPRVIYDPDRKFQVTTGQEATLLQHEEIPFNIFYFNHAREACQVSDEAIIKKMRLIFKSEFSLWLTLNSAFPNAEQKLKEKKLSIVIDNFSDFAGDRPAFNNYFVNLQGHPVVGINCSQLSMSYWASSLAHELTHALLSGTNTEMWWEEGIAQVIESEAGGDQPVLTLKHLKTPETELLETRRPLPSKQSYAMNQLFVRYIKNQFGGWPVLQAMSTPSTSSCENQIDFLTKITCRGKLFLENNPQQAKTLGADKMTRTGLLRYFAVALTLNDSWNKFYKIPGWQGFTLPSEPALTALKPAQFIAYDTNGNPKELNPNLEYYRILSDLNGHHVILARDKMHDEESLKLAQEKLKTIKKDFILILNSGFKSESIPQD